MDETSLRATAFETLEELGRLPAVPYYEQAGVAYVTRFCEEAGLDVKVDRFGNVLAARPGDDSAAPAVAFVSHLDHPGFEAVSEEDGRLVARALGGVPPAAREGGVPVQCVVGRNERVPGRILGLAAGEDRAVLVDAGGTRVTPLPCAVVFDLPDFDLDGEMIRMRALDDLAGCAAILAALRHAAATPSPGTVYGLFTRAEETGLIGARLAAEDGLLPEGAVVVSLESSRALPGAGIGDGPVIRTGDRLTTFDRIAEAVLQAARERLAARDEGFACQRQLMSGGVCEATAFAAFGYPVTGLAFPLGNYHNNGPNGSIAAEYVHMDDFIGGAHLLAEVASQAGSVPSRKVGAWFHERPDEGARRLLDG